MMDPQTSTLPPGEWEMVWNDEFEGTELNTEKWLYRQHRFGAVVPQWCPEAVVVRDGHLELLAMEKDGEYYCGAIQTGANSMDMPKQKLCWHDELSWNIGPLKKPTFEHTYGYWEARCKLPTQHGWWGAFWLQSSTIGTCLDPARAGVEFDVLESFKRNGEIVQNLHWGGYGEDHQHDGSGPFQVDDWQSGWHNYGVNWTPEAVVFYLDGKETWRSSAAVPHCPQFLLLTTEIQGAQGGQQKGDRIKSAALPDRFMVDHVRVFDPLHI